MPFLSEPIWWLCASVFVAACSTILVRFAALRSQQQPIAEHPAAERDVLRAVLEDPRLSMVAWAGAGLTAQDFAHPHRRAIWQVLCSQLGQGKPVTREALEPVLSKDELVELDSILELDVPGAEASGEAATSVAWGGDDRRRYPGAVGLEQTGGDPALCWAPVRISWRRRVAAAVIGAAGVVVASWAAPQVASDVWAGVAFATLLATVAVGVVLALVDHDTLLVDMTTVVGGGLAVWAGAAGVVVAEGRPTALLFALFAIGGWAFVFFIGNLYYRITAGIDGIGGGDIWIIAVTTGVPTVLAGTPLLAVWSVLAAMLLALLATLPGFITGTRDRRAPFALGPYLAVGWIVAWPAAQLGGLM